MSMKKFGYLLITGLIVLLLTVLLKASCVLASQTVLDEIEQSVTVEEIKSIDNHVQTNSTNPTCDTNSAEQNYNPDNSKTDEELNNLLNQNPENCEDEKAVSSDGTEASSGNKKDLPDTKSSSSAYAVKNAENSKNRILDDAQKTRLGLSDTWGKCFGWTQKLLLMGVFEYLSTRPFFKKYNLLAQHTTDKKQINNPDFLPYYFIYPSFQKDCLEKAYFSGKISDISEFMPYSLSIRCTTPKLDVPKNIVTPQGTTDILVLINAPSPKILVTGKALFAKLVIDIRNNTLYKYDKNGMPLKAYLVATGARGTRTLPGLRIVTYKESFPYAGDPESKRALDPYSYGPYIIFVNVVDPNTGRQYVIEQLLHGNGNEYSIGKKVSHGCVRTNNNVMRKELSKEVKRGDYILLINPDIG